MRDLGNIIEWRNSLGLLPVNLCSFDPQIQRYILLNGGSGDFCLQLNGQEESEEFYFSAAWSSNTKNFVLLNEQALKIYNWRKDKVETLATDAVNRNFLKFYDYLIANSFSSEADLVPFVVNIFRKIRNLVNDKDDAKESLNLLFILLTSLEEQDISQLDIAKWGLEEAQFPAQIEDYIKEFKDGTSHIKPKLDLILRHSSGVLFQEAQKEALYFNKQQNMFTGTLSGDFRTRKKLYSSIHYTPAYLARAIVENALAKLSLTSATLKIFDPACGASEFLMEALKQLKAKNYGGTVSIIGWDSSPTAINTSRFLLTYEKREWGERLEIELKLVQDSLAEEWTTDYDCILMNPPFVSWELMDKSSREYTRSALEYSFDGKPNQASAFFYKSVMALNQDGVIGSVIPSSLMTLDAYVKLRDVLNQSITVELIGKLGNFVFEDALTDVSLVVGKKSNTNTAPILIWTKNEKGLASEALRDLRKMQYSNAQSVIEKNYSIYQPTSFPLNDQSWNITSFQDYEFFKKIERFVADGRLVRVQDIFNVQQGIRTGLNNVFKINSAYYNQIPNTEKNYFKPVIDNDAIHLGVLTKNNYVWYPYNKDGLIFKTEDQVRDRVPFFYSNVLLPNKGELEKRSGITEWWALTRPRNWQYSGFKGISSTEFGKSNSFAFDSKGEYVIERGNAWIPKKTFPRDDVYYFYLAIFSSPTFDKLLSVYSRQLLSGWDLGKKFTKNIPIPSIFSPDVVNSASFEKLVYLGKQLSNKELFNSSPIDEILRLYIYPSSK